MGRRPPEGPIPERVAESPPPCPLPHPAGLVILGSLEVGPHRHQAGDDGGGERGTVNGGQGGPDVREKHPECDLILWLHPLNEGGPIRKRSLKP